MFFFLLLNFPLIHVRLGLGFQVYGSSMLPTLNLTGDVLLTEHISPLLGKVGPGDVVVVRSPENPRKKITKRILGMEGDLVTFLPDPAHSDRTLTVKVPSICCSLIIDRMIA